MKLKINKEYLPFIQIEEGDEMTDPTINCNFAIEGYHVQIATYQSKKFIACLFDGDTLYTLGEFKNVNDAILQCKIDCCRKVVAIENN